jgi:MarR family transcriptional regulator, lower aerobic nicotinate degradation pathway regulator
MNRYDLLKEIVEQVEAFEHDKKTGEDLNLNDFAQWLAIKTQPKAASNTLNSLQEPIVFEGGVIESSETDELGTLVSLLYRYVKIYAKRAMENSPLSNVDDFSYLIIPMVHGAMSKTELIAHNAHEKTTGMEIIKRLTKLGFLAQTDDPTDGRSQLVHISETGRSVLFPLLTEMRKVSVIANGNLSESELATLIHLLRKLDVFHKGILNHEKTVDLNNILAKYF